MATTADYLSQLQADKQALVDNLVEKGVEATNDETFTSLVPKVLNIQSGGGDAELEASYLSMIDETLGANVTKLPQGIKIIGNYAFSRRTNLVLKELPETLTDIYGYAFERCTNLAIKSLPVGITLISTAIFSNCTGITEMTCYGAITEILSQCFANTSLAKFVLPNIRSVPKLHSYGAFNGTPIAKGTGYIYVPDNLVDGFKVASNWSNFADVILPISQMPAE